jgi:MoxR-like ATPase
VGKKRLWWGAITAPEFEEKVTVAEIKRAQEEVRTTGWTPESQEAFETIMEEIVHPSKLAIPVGDRRARKAVNVCQAAAFLEGHEQVQTEDLWPLAHVLWDAPEEQPEKVHKVVARIANPVASQITGKLLDAEDIIDKSRPAEAVPKLQVIVKDLKAMKDHPRRDKTVAYLQERIKELYDKVLVR